MLLYIVYTPRQEITYETMLGGRKEMMMCEQVTDRVKTNITCSGQN